MKATIKLIDSTTDRHCMIVWQNIVLVEYASGSNQAIDKALLTFVNGEKICVQESVMGVATLIELAARDG